MGYHSVAITSLHSRPPSALDLYCVSPLPAQVITKLRQRPKWEWDLFHQRMGIS